MDLEIITVGAELLLGFTLDSNSADIAKALAPVGVRVVRSTSVRDDADDIRNVVAGALDRTGFVIVTGGLGPTRDDVTKVAVAALFQIPLELDHAYLEILRTRFQQFGRGPMPESNRTQAEIPRGAVVLPNRRGTAPGLWITGEAGTVVMLPGIPGEVHGLLHDHVLPRLGEVLGTGDPLVIRSRTLRTAGVSESNLADRLGSFEAQLRSVSLAYLPTLDGVDLRMTVWNVASARADDILNEAAEVLHTELGRDVYGETGVDIAAVVIDLLRSRQHRLAVAESCTGGLIGSRVSAIPGASDVFVGGFITYADTAKISELGVSESDLAQHGAVSETVARAMARGACEQLGTEASIAVTGIAGPSGGSEQKPVGTVWFACQTSEGLRSLRRWLPGDRDEVRRRAAQAGLDLLRRQLSG